ncbi:MAG: hypothetical protein ACI9XO_002004 [Paraglaciecola sp.]|jgi:hypothetical protein
MKKITTFQKNTHISGVPIQLLLFIIVTFLVISPIKTYAQPNLGTAANFLLFTSVGDVVNTGTSVINGNIGTNTGAVTGFGSPSIINGNTEIVNGVTAQCATDIEAAYTEIFNTTSTVTNHTPEFGGGETLVAGVYGTVPAGSVSGDLTLDGGGIFIFKFGGALDMAANTTVILTNGTQASDVFWISGGAITMGASNIVKGTLISSPGAVSMALGGDLEGRMLSTAGAINVNELQASDDSPALPISLLSFSAHCEEENIVLKWSTATESNNDYFTIEKRSGNRLAWQTAGIVAGAGNSNAKLYYELKDLTPNAEESYYRLKQTDFDGNFEYAGIIRIQKCEDIAVEHLSIYPNPSSGQFKLLFNGDQSKINLIDIFDSKGQNVYSWTVLPSEFDLSNYVSGFYFMRVQINSEVISLNLILNN